MRHARHSTNSRTLNVHSKKIMSQAKNERFSDSCKIDKLVYTTKTSHTCLQPMHSLFDFSKKKLYAKLIPKKWSVSKNLLMQFLRILQHFANRILFIETRKNHSGFYNWLLEKPKMFNQVEKYTSKYLMIPSNKLSFVICISKPDSLLDFWNYPCTNRFFDLLWTLLCTIDQHSKTA